MTYPPSDVRRVWSPYSSEVRKVYVLYTKARAQKKYNAGVNWLMHYLGASRIVYDTERRSWTTATWTWHPLTWIVFLVAILYVGFWSGGWSSVVEDLSKDRPLFRSTFERRDDGAYRFLPYSRAFDFNE